MNSTATRKLLLLLEAIRDLAVETRDSLHYCQAAMHFVVSSLVNRTFNDCTTARRLPKILSEALEATGGYTVCDCCQRRASLKHWSSDTNPRPHWQFQMRINGIQTCHLGRRPMPKLRLYFPD